MFFLQNCDNSNFDWQHIIQSPCSLAGKSSKHPKISFLNWKIMKITYFFKQADLLDWFSDFPFQQNCPNLIMLSREFKIKINYWGDQRWPLKIAVFFWWGKWWVCLTFSADLRSQRVFFRWIIQETLVGDTKAKKNFLKKRTLIKFICIS